MGAGCTTPGKDVLERVNQPTARRTQIEGSRAPPATGVVPATPARGPREPRRPPAHAVPPPSPPLDTATREVSAPQPREMAPDPEAVPARLAALASCPRCQASNEFLAPAGVQSRVRCGQCSHEFTVSMPRAPAPQPPPPPTAADALRLCQRCGTLNQYPMPERGVPSPHVRCGHCGALSRASRIGSSPVSASDNGSDPAVFTSYDSHRNERVGVPIRQLQEAPPKPKLPSIETVASLPTYTVTPSQRPCKECACSICLDRYVDGDTVKTLPCRHIYHMHCIDRWLGGHNSCPECRAEVEDPPLKSAEA